MTTRNRGHRGIGGWAALAVGALAAVAVVLVLADLSLFLVLFGPKDGAQRIATDVRRIYAARAVETGRTDATAAFARLYGPSPVAIREAVRFSGDPGEPVVFDAVMAQTALARRGAVDARTLPPGVYLGAGPIGPDGWPWRLASELFFPRHGYLLIVPPGEAGGYPEAIEVSASLRSDFRPGGDPDALFASAEPYRPGSFDFPRAGEPVHELHRLAVPPAGIRAVQRRVEAEVAAIRNDDRRYRLLQRNSNTALACLLEAADFSQANLSAIDGWIFRLRLPGLRVARPCRRV